jgi:hypothetical protein
VSTPLQAIRFSPHIYSNKNGIKKKIVSRISHLAARDHCISLGLHSTSRGIYHTKYSHKSADLLSLNGEDERLILSHLSDSHSIFGILALIPSCFSMASLCSRLMFCSSCLASWYESNYFPSWHSSFSSLHDIGEK